MMNFFAFKEVDKYMGVSLVNLRQVCMTKHVT